MVDTSIVINQKKAVNAIEQVIENLRHKDRGAIVFVSGEIGSGKTHLLRHFAGKLQSSSDLISYYTECHKPIGKFRISEMQPLQPFANLVDDVIKKKIVTPEKKLAVSIGLTTLAAIPVVGEFFYAIKELAKDWRQYKIEKSSKSFEKMNSLTADFYDIIASFVDKNKLVFLLDNVDLADVLSIELLRFLTYKINEQKLVIICSYTPNLMPIEVPHFTKYLSEFQEHPNFQQVSLVPFEIGDIIQSIGIYSLDVRSKSEFGQWLLSSTKGNPSSVFGYLEYFSRNKLLLQSFDSESELSKFNVFPGTIHSAVSDWVKDLSEEDKNLLSICSAEGKQFSVLVVSHLLNEDVLSTVKKLKSLQSGTGIIKSLGYQTKYGQKTTIYEFTQTAFYEYFFNLLEYEEKIFLRRTISSYLQQLFNNSNNEFIKQQLAPYIAAYSTEAGDIDTTNAMLKYAVLYSQSYGNSDLVESIYNEFLRINADFQSQDYQTLHSEFANILSALKESSKILEAVEQIGSNEEENILSNMDVDDIDEYFQKVRKIASDLIFQKNFIQAYTLATGFYEKYKSRSTDFQIVQILLLAVKALVNLNDFEQAQNYLNIVKSILDGKDEPVLKCFLLNVESEFHLKKNNDEEAYELLREAVELSLKLSDELQLLTLANIALYLKNKSSEDADLYFEAVRKISKQLNFSDFEKLFSERISQN